MYLIVEVGWRGPGPNLLFLFDELFWGELEVSPDPLLFLLVRFPVEAPTGGPSGRAERVSGGAETALRLARRRFGAAAAAAATVGPVATARGGAAATAAIPARPPPLVGAGAAATRLMIAVTTLPRCPVDVIIS